MQTPTNASRIARKQNGSVCGGLIQQATGFIFIEDDAFEEMFRVVETLWKPLVIRSLQRVFNNVDGRLRLFHLRIIHPLLIFGPFSFLKTMPLF